MEPVFLPLEKKHYSSLLPYFSLRPTECSESQFLYHAIWENYYETQFALSPTGILWMQKIHPYEHACLLPVCKKEHLKENFQTIQDYFTFGLHTKLAMFLVDQEALDIIAPDTARYQITEDVDSFDYIYDANKLRLLSGRSYHKKKNHVNAFLKEYGTRYEYKKLTLEQNQELLDFSQKWFQKKLSQDAFNRLENEENGLRNLLNCYSVTDIRMAGIYVDGTLEAFTLGNYNEEFQMAVIHIEKANTGIRGLYPFINQQFLIHEFPGAIYVNREDDMGIPSLRKAKEAYNPIKMGKKYTILEK